MWLEVSSITSVEELKRAAISLAVEEYRKFRQWFLERNWAEWNQHRRM
jgi:hypothetical protein